MVDDVPYRQVMVISPEALSSQVSACEEEERQVCTWNIEEEHEVSTWNMGLVGRGVHI